MKARNKLGGIGPPDPSGGTDLTLPQEPAAATPYFSEINAIWPELANSQANISPARNGMNRLTGQLLQGWDHVEQSMSVIFMTPFHERVLRRWVGSFVPMLLGEDYIGRVITRFFWAIAVAIDLWEPDYRIKRVYYMGAALSNSPTTVDATGLVRIGQAIFQTQGVYRPRAHLGDDTPYVQKQIGLVGHGQNVWDLVPPS